MIETQKPPLTGWFEELGVWLVDCEAVGEGLLNTSGANCCEGSGVFASGQWISDSDFHLNAERVEGRIDETGVGWAKRGSLVEVDRDWRYRKGGSALHNRVVRSEGDSSWVA